MSPVLLLGGIPALAAFAAAPIAGADPVQTYAALVIVVGWIPALVGTAMLMDESMLAALVYFGMSALMFVIWLTVPDGTF